MIFQRKKIALSFFVLIIDFFYKKIYFNSFSLLLIGAAGRNVSAKLAARFLNDFYAVANEIDCMKHCTKK